MKNIKVYKPPGREAQMTDFFETLDPRLRDKLIRQLIALPHTPRAALREPHFKHFSLERYRDLYELRERGRVMVRVIFTLLPDGAVLLLYAFVKRQRRDTMQALERALQVLAAFREHPEYAAEFTVREERL